MNRQLNQYQKVNVSTMKRGKIVVMLYTGAITFLNKAKINIEKKNFPQKNKFIVKSQNIIDELNYSLDMEKGKEISKNLRSLYNFMNRHLIKANIGNDSKKIDDVIKMLTELRDAFNTIITDPQYSEAQQINKKELTKNAIKKYV